MNTPNSDLGRRALEEADLHVTKIGGENAMEMEVNTARILGNDKRQGVVISALRSPEFNTTSTLIRLAEHLERDETQAVQTRIDELQAFHVEAVQTNAEPAQQGELMRVLDQEFSRLKSSVETVANMKPEDRLFVRDGADVSVHLQSRFSITGFGEDLAERLYQKYLTLRGRQAETLDVGEPDSLNALRIALQEEVRRKLTAHDALVVSGGYKPVLASIRSYTDLTAAEIARAADQGSLQTALSVEKQYPILSADPRRLGSDKAHLIPQMSWVRAAELFGIYGANAGALHPQVISRLSDTNVSIVIHNPSEPSLGSTLIGPNTNDNEGLPIVATKNIPSTLQVRGPMSEITKIVLRIAQALEGFNIDQIYTSDSSLIFTLTVPIPPNLTTTLADSLSAQNGFRYQVEARTDYASVMTLGASDEVPQKGLLKRAGVHVPYDSTIADIQFTGFIIPADQVALAIRTLHTGLYARP